jgi:hypothetical protein
VDNLVDKLFNWGSKPLTSGGALDWSFFDQCKKIHIKQILADITSSAIRKSIAKETIQKLHRIIVHKKLDMLLLVTLSNGF